MENCKSKENLFKEERKEVAPINIRTHFFTVCMMEYCTGTGCSKKCGVSILGDKCSKVVWTLSWASIPA